MDKIILIDGNNLVFRSYYATAYSGSLMKNSKGFPTNALYALINMLNKIITTEKPTHIMMAFDKGKTFRHLKYKDYKAGRSETPIELKQQFQKAKELVSVMGIKYLEIDNYEADDIIGTYANYIDNNNLEGLIISSDKDLIQLISDKVSMKVLKSNDSILMNKNTFKEIYGIDDPKKMIDLKALMGDSSDNIPGVHGIGEKTAISLIQKYNSLDGVYNNLNLISPGTSKKLETDKENAYMSYDLATIYKSVPININLKDIEYHGLCLHEYKKLLEELEFFSLIKKLETDEINENKEISYKKITNIDELNIKEPYSIYLETLGYNYHSDIPIGVSITDKNGSFYIPFEILKDSSIFLDNKQKYTYDLKKLLYVFDKYNIKIDKKIDDLMLISYLLNKNIKNDIANLANTYLYGIRFYDKIYGTEITLRMPLDNNYIKDIVLKSNFIYNEYQGLYDELKKEEMIDLYKNIELPLSYVLMKMEKNGFLVDTDYLKKFGDKLLIKLQELEKQIYNLAGTNFNILSPKQLADVLFVKLNIPYPKKTKKSYSTGKDILDKLKDKYEIVNLILDYRTLSKMRSNYVIGLIDEVDNDSKIHTIYNQTLTRTGRLSSEKPNLQNIPIRDDLGKLIRIGFIPEKKENKIASFDYSQIELRVFASMANAEDMIDAFKNGIDIHTKTASQIFNVPLEKVTKDMRRKAKAVNFGIIYGISSFGLSEDLGINTTDAKNFIDSYLKAFPGIKDYMNSLVYNAYKNGYVKTLTNRKRIIDEINNKNYIIRQSGERMALNTPIQGTAADILKIAMVKINDEMERLNLKSKLLVQVHDELVFEVSRGEENTLKDLVINIMKNAYKLNAPLDVSYEIGDNWYDAK